MVTCFLMVLPLYIAAPFLSNLEKKKPKSSANQQAEDLNDEMCVRAFASKRGLTVMPSASYSSCSDLRVSSMKSCCNFSLQ